MKIQLLFALLFTSIATTAGADTYYVEGDIRRSNHAPKLIANHDAEFCTYADKKIKPGDTIVIGPAGIVLVCTSSLDGTVFYSLSASGIQRVLASKPIDQTNKLSEVDSYKISVSTPPGFAPLKVWNDGQSTFIELTQQYKGELPVLFSLAEDGKRSLVNYRWDNKNLRFIVDQVLERAILVLGDKNVVVSKT